MYFMVILVLDNVDQCTNILDAWEETGVGGVTILESTGLGRARKFQFRDDFPLMPSLSDFLRKSEERHRTLFTVVEGEEEVDRIIAATESVIGDLEQAHNGILFTLPVARVKGLAGGKSRAQKGKNE
ncbi:MAG: hypothetical protein D6835_06635 [Candidatus Thermofonsia bacterium]|nr:MAG: hypothetical protein D6835_06635 [Candidatus Thermofonsia bacterium]